MLEPGKNETPVQQPTRLIRLKEVMHRVGLGRSTIYRWMDEGKFPKPVRLGVRTVAWEESDIDLWVQSKTAELDCDI